MAKVLLQPIWDAILTRHRYLVSYWLFPTLLGWVVYAVIGIYFTIKDIGPWKSIATRVDANNLPKKKDVVRVSLIQLGVYAVLNAIIWYTFPYHTVLPKHAPSVFQLFTDITVSFLIGDFLVYVEHILHHKIRFLYRHVHYVHHRFKSDLFSWTAGWVHPFELSVFAFCMIVWPWIVYPVHPLSLWIYIAIFIALLLEEHSGHDLWWSPYKWIPVLFGGAVPHEVHHSKINCNYGFVLAIWDRLFGTYIPPACEVRKNSS